MYFQIGVYTIVILTFYTIGITSQDTCDISGIVKAVIDHQNNIKSVNIVYDKYYEWQVNSLARRLGEDTVQKRLISLHFIVEKPNYATENYTDVLAQASDRRDVINVLMVSDRLTVYILKKIQYFQIEIPRSWRWIVNMKDMTKLKVFPDITVLLLVPAIQNNALDDKLNNTLACSNIENYDDRCCSRLEYRLKRQDLAEDVAYWRENEGLQILKKKMYPGRNIYNFHGKRFLVTSLTYSFFQKKITLPDGSIKWVGLTFELMNELAWQLNFTYDVIEPPDGKWGIDEGNNSWNGMINEVYQNNVDFAAAGFSVTPSRDKLLDFPKGYFSDHAAVIIKKPKKTSRVLFYVRPLSYYVWFSIFTCILLCGPLLWLIVRCDIACNEGEVEKVKKGQIPLSDSMFYIFGTIVQQGGYRTLVSKPGRLLVAAFWFFVIAVIATYTGNLVAFLTVSTLKMPFNTLSEMAAQSKFEYGTMEGVGLQMVFRKATWEPYTSIHKQMSTVVDYTHGLKRVKEGKYAFIAEKSWYYAIAANDNEIAMIDELFYPNSYAFAMPPNSPLVNVFSERINNFRETGLLAHWIDRWVPKGALGKQKAETGATKATLDDIQGALYVLLLGLAAGTLALAAEYASKYYVVVVKRLHAKERSSNEYKT